MLSSCCDSVAEHWQLQSEVSWVRLPATVVLAFSLPSIISSQHLHVIPLIHITIVKQLHVKADVYMCMLVQ